MGNQVEAAPRRGQRVGQPPGVEARHIKSATVISHFGDKIVLCGGMDARNLVANDTHAIRAELAEKIPVVKEDYGYILHSDHSIPTTTEYDTERFFVDEGLRLGTY